MARYKTWSAWFHGLIGALQGAVATAGISYLTSIVTGLDVKWRQFGITVGVAALVQGFFYLRDSPLPFSDLEPAEIPPVRTETPKTP